jgi:hypothetical protein
VHLLLNVQRYSNSIVQWGRATQHCMVRLLVLPQPVARWLQL